MGGEGDAEPRAAAEVMTWPMGMCVVRRCVESVVDAHVDSGILQDVGHGRLEVPRT